MWDWLAKLSSLKAAGQYCVLVSITNVSGSSPREVGTKLIVLQDGSFYGTIGGGQLESLVLSDARNCFTTKLSVAKRYPLCVRAGQCCGGIVDVFFDFITPAPKLYLFGAGHVGRAVCRVLEDAPFEVYVVDEREEWVLASEIPQRTHRYQWPSQTFIDKADFDEKQTYAAIMTHSHDLDFELCKALLKKPLRYLGLIGSKNKWQTFQQKLLLHGFSAQEIEKIRCPLGLPIGGKSPAEVAISLSAELIRLHHEPLHDR